MTPNLRPADRPLLDGWFLRWLDAWLRRADAAPRRLPHD